MRTAREHDEDDDRSEHDPENAVIATYRSQRVRSAARTAPRGDRRSPASRTRARGRGRASGRRFAPVRVHEEADEAGRERLRVARRHEEPVDAVGDHLPVAGDVGGDDRARPAAIASTRTIPKLSCPVAGHERVARRGVGRHRWRWARRRGMSTRSRGPRASPRASRSFPSPTTTSTASGLGHRFANAARATGNPFCASSRFTHRIRRPSGRPSRGVAPANAATSTPFGTISSSPPKGPARRTTRPPPTPRSAARRFARPAGGAGPRAPSRGIGRGA